MRSAAALGLALTLVLAAACGDGDGGTKGSLPTAVLAVTDDAGGRAELTVELARTPEEKSRGLMFRDELAEDSAMLFVYAGDTSAGFWMKDTSIRLSIAFIADDGAILDIQEMEPLSTELHRPPRPYRFALEVNQGWFGRHGLGTGDRVEIPESVTSVP